MMADLPHWAHCRKETRHLNRIEASPSKNYLDPNVSSVEAEEQHSEVEQVA